jgi:hypothetical protein
MHYHTNFEFWDPRGEIRKEGEKYSRHDFRRGIGLAQAHLKLRMGGRDIWEGLDLALEIVNRSFGDS